MKGDPRYARGDALMPAQLPPVTREEADRAARRLFRHFGGTRHGSPNMRYRSRFRRVRRCWLSRVQTAGHYKGWGRLIHDVSHSVFSDRHPSFRPHDGGHAALEREMTEYALTEGWLNGTLRSHVPTREERRARELARLEQRLARWESRERRAKTAIRKLRLMVKRRAP